jgi:pilus assembly protein CpaF
VTATAQSILESEVRELVRQRGLDPADAPDVVAELVTAAVGDYRDRAVTSALPPLGDATVVGRAVLDAVAGLGPLQPLLDDPSVEEIWINEPNRNRRRRPNVNHDKFSAFGSPPLRCWRPVRGRHTQR